MGRAGLRVLAVAKKTLATGEHPTSTDRITGATFLGLIGMLDPARQEVPEAIRACRASGVRVVMLTGDHATTAAAVAQQIGLDAQQGVVDGRTVERLSDTDLEAVCSTTAVFARVEPEHKLRIVRALQRQGNVVAVTGDGVNDAPALNAADLGVAMGLRGTDVAREASRARDHG